MSKIKQVIRLRRNGLPLQTIAEAVEASRNTVKKYIRLIEARQLNEDLLLLMDDEALEALLNGPLVDDDAARVKTLTGLLCVRHVYHAIGCKSRIRFAVGSISQGQGCRG